LPDRNGHDRDDRKRLKSVLPIPGLKIAEIVFLSIRDFAKVLALKRMGSLFHR